MWWAAGPQCLGLVMGIALGEALLIFPLRPAMLHTCRMSSSAVPGGGSSPWLPGCRLGNTMTASLHFLCADTLGPHSHAPVTQNDINQSKFSPQWKQAAPGQEGGLSSRVLLTKVGMVMGRRCKGKQKPYPSPVGSPGAFRRRQELWVAAEGVTCLSASGMEMPAAIQAEELHAKCRCSHTGNQLAVKGTGRHLGLPRKGLSCLLGRSACRCGQRSPAVETSLPQKCSPEAGDPEWEG